jgi:hypothetical protein
VLRSPVAVFAGLLSVGEPGRSAVVNDRIAESGAVTETFLATTFHQYFVFGEAEKE